MNCSSIAICRNKKNSDSNNFKIATMTVTRQSRRLELFKEFEQFLESIYNEHLSDDQNGLEKFIAAMKNKLDVTSRHDHHMYLFGDKSLIDKTRPQYHGRPYMDMIFPIVIRPDDHDLDTKFNMNSHIYETINEKLRAYNVELAGLPLKVTHVPIEFSDDGIMKAFSDCLDIAGREYAQYA